MARGGPPSRATPRGASMSPERLVWWLVAAILLIVFLILVFEVIDVRVD